jgi:predicted transcriptional regulator
MEMVTNKYNSNKSGERRSSKFYSKSLTLMVSILEMINEGLRASEIARGLNRSKSLVSHYVTKAKEDGLVIEIKRDVFAELQLTQSGKKFLDQYHDRRISQVS